MDMFVLQMFNGLSISSILLLIALGLAVTFGLMNVINMAHGELIMIGAYATYVTQNLFISYAPAAWFEVYFIVALPIAFGVAALIGWLLEVILIRHLYGRPLDSLLATWGVGMMLQQLARTIFGAPNVGCPARPGLTADLRFLTVSYFRINGFLSSHLSRLSCCVCIFTSTALLPDDGCALSCRTGAWRAVSGFRPDG